MRWGVLRAYSCFNAGTGPTKKQRRHKMYLDYDLGWSRERATQMRTEVERNRLQASLARATRSNEDSLTRRGKIARGAALITALFR
jgi:hypothetical protein